jgi:hypothetical protein
LSRRNRERQYSVHAQQMPELSVPVMGVKAERFTEPARRYPGLYVA